MLFFKEKEEGTKKWWFVQSDNERELADAARRAKAQIKEDARGKHLDLRENQKKRIQERS